MPIRNAKTILTFRKLLVRLWARSAEDIGAIEVLLIDWWIDPRVKLSIVGSLRDREVACSASDRQDSNFESSVWRTVSSHSSHHPQEVLLAQFSLYVHKGGLKPDSFHLPSKHYVHWNNVGLLLVHRLRRWPNNTSMYNVQWASYTFENACGVQQCRAKVTNSNCLLEKQAATVVCLRSAE